MVAGFHRAGRDVLIDEDVRILRPDLLSVGSHIRVDAGVIISGSHPVVLGDHVHLSAGSKIFASGGPVEIQDFAGLSVDVKLFTASDDYTGGWMTNPTVPERFRSVTVGPVLLEEHALVGAGSVLLPGTTLRFGSAVGALSLVAGEVASGVVVLGSPARPVGRRDTERLRRLAEELRVEEGGAG